MFFFFGECFCSGSMSFFLRSQLWWMETPGSLFFYRKNVFLFCDVVGTGENIEHVKRSAMWSVFGRWDRVNFSQKKIGKTNDNNKPCLPTLENVSYFARFTFFNFQKKREKYSFWIFFQKNKVGRSIVDTQMGEPLFLPTSIVKLVWVMFLSCQKNQKKTSKRNNIF